MGSLGVILNAEQSDAAVSRNNRINLFVRHSDTSKTEASLCAAGA